MVSVIASDLRVEGALSGSGVIRIEGTVVGTVRAEYQVLVSEGGTVEGDVYAREAILGGEVKGSILADGSVEVQATAVIHGDIKTPYLVVDEGATVCGPIHMAARFGSGLRPDGNDTTVATLFDNYIREVTPAKGRDKQRHDRATAKMLKHFLGPERKARTLNRRDWDRFIRERRAGSIAPKGSQPGRAVGARQIEYDLKFLLAVLHWGTRARSDGGEPLLQRNPLSGLPLPKEESPARPVLTDEQYKAFQAVAADVDWRFALALTLAHETGHRIGAVRMLRWLDIDLDTGSVTWRAENDKIGFEHETPLSEVAVDALRKARRAHPVIGDVWVFPSPDDPTTPCSRHIMRDWWEQARELAALAHVPRLGWHSVRRKFASELKATPLKDLCELGGWKDPHTILKCYMRPDQGTMRRALQQRRALQNR